MNKASIIRNPTFLTGFALFLVTLALYWPVTGHKFLTYDDGQYVVDNPQVRHGLTLAGVKWALTSFYAANWHPLTWVSHMLDWSIYGPFAGGHLLTNAVFHSLNTLLVFLVLKRMTKAFWPSALVAALFGWHPLHVESVAWVSERKDVLSTFFMLLTLGAYARYAERPATVRYLMVLLLFIMGLMSKPMLVTLPCVLLLLDYWPLRRWTDDAQPASGAARKWRLIVEKLPFLVLSIVACVLTVLAQSTESAIALLRNISLSLRVWNSLAAYGQYLLDTVWPSGLCILYPLPDWPPVLAGSVSALALAAITGFVWCGRARRPWAWMGWLWFLGTLVPVIGLVQVGSQAMADRYTYIPLIGLFVALVWSIDAAIAGQPWRRKGGISTAILLLLVCLVMTRRQIGFWQDSVTLFTRTVRVTSQNRDAEDNLGVAFARAGRGTEAVAHYREAIRIDPEDVFPRFNLGIELIAEGRFAEAELQFSEALKRNPESRLLHNELGVVLAFQGRLGPAMEHFREAIRINPAFPDPYLNLAIALQKQGATEAALTNYQKALELNPAWPEAVDKLALLLVTARETNIYNPAAAVKLSRYANELTAYQSSGYLDTLAQTLAAGGDYSNAVFIAQQAHKLALDQTNAALAAKLEAESNLYQAGKKPPRGE